MPEEMSPEEVLEHLPPEARELVAHLRVGVLSLPGVEEEGVYHPKDEDYSLRFSVGGETILRTHTKDGIQATVELGEEDLQDLMRRPDLPDLELEVPEGGTRTLREMLEAGPEGGGRTLEVAIRTLDGVRSLLRIAHAKYDAVMAR